MSYFSSQGLRGAPQRAKSLFPCLACRDFAGMLRRRRCLEMIVYFGIIVCFVLTNTWACAKAGSERDPPRVCKGQKAARLDSPMPPGDLTIWKLKEMAEQGRTAELEDMFNHGFSLCALPTGYSAGAGAAADPITTALDTLIGDYWRGKIFFNSSERRETHGLNRIKQDFLNSDAPIVPMAAFTAQLLDTHELAPEATSNVIVLKYAHPVTKSYWQEEALTQIQVIDVMVAVPGKYGPVYLGKTWLGQYDAEGVFRANDQKQFIAWYFLDFNQSAMGEQLAYHWDRSDEVPIDYADCGGRKAVSCVWIASPARARGQFSP